MFKLQSDLLDWCHLEGTDTSADTSPERTPEGAEGVTIEGHKEVASIIDDGDEVEDVFDSVSVPDPRDPLGLGVARPPIRSSGDSIYTSSLTPRQVAGDPSNWSTQIHQFFPRGCVITPELVVRSIDHGLLSFSPSLSLSPRLNLRPIFGGENLSRSATPSLLPQLQFFPSRMEEGDYKARLADIKAEMAKVRRRIDYFTADDVTIADKDGYQDYLNENRMMLEVCQELVFKLSQELDDGARDDELRIQQIEKLDTDLSKQCKLNAKQVKEKMVQLLTAFEASRPLSSLEENKLDLMKRKEVRESEKEAKMAQEKKQKTELKMKNAVKKWQYLSKKVLSIKHTEQLSEQEIREHLIQSKNWEKQVSDLATYKENIDEDMIGIDIDPNLKKEMDDAFEEAIDGVTNKIEHLTPLPLIK